MMPYPTMTDAEIYAECLRYMARWPALDWRRDADDEWKRGLADFIESQQAEIERLSGRIIP